MIDADNITNSPRVLLMSHELDEAAIRSSYLTKAGWQVIHVSEPVEALAMVRSRDIDVVLLHLPLDDMVSMDLPNVLREIAPSPYLPVMILADNPADQQRCLFLDSGADDVICVRTSASEMMARLRALLRTKELQDELAASRSALQEALKRERELMVRLRKDNAYLKVLATTDPLTHVQNVRSFHDILHHEFRIARRYTQPISLLTMDVDHFKLVNDSHGHPSGDYILKELAVILTQSVRESDVVARTGGEEFSIILPRADRSSSLQFAERIRKEVASRHFNCYGCDINVTISIGSATFPSTAEDIECPEMLVYFSDQALLVAKESGRDRVVDFHNLAPSVRERLGRQYLTSTLEKIAEKDAAPADGVSRKIPIETE